MRNRIQSTQVLELLHQYHIGVRQAAELCSVGYRTFRRWIHDSPSMPRTAWELLMIRIKTQPAWDGNKKSPVGGGIGDGNEDL
jgi:hypothetical protein